MVEITTLGKLTGAIIGHYRLEELVEQHPWGPIFLAKDKADKHYYVRFLGTPLIEERCSCPPEQHMIYLGHFQQEANRITSLQHTQIHPLLDYGNLEGTPYLVYPYTHMSSLRSLLNPQNTTDPRSVGRYLEQIVDALSYAHEQGILHRNLSTACIMLQANRRLLITEFGILRLRQQYWQHLHATPTTKYSFEGSSETCAPEQLLNQPVDASTDTYALGAVLYRLLTCHPPFEGKTREEVLRQHLYAQPSSLSQWRSDLSPDLDKVISKAMAKEPAQRFSDLYNVVDMYWHIVAPNEARRGRTSTKMAVPSTDAFSAIHIQSAVHTEPRPKISAQPTSTPYRQSTPTSRRGLLKLLAVGGLTSAALVGAALAFDYTHQTPGTAGTAPHKQQNTGTMAGGQTTTTQSTPTQQATTTGNQTNNKGTVLAKTTDVPRNSAKTFPLPNQNNPGILVHLSNGQFVAFDSTCTHAGCAVNYNQQSKLLHCPCHDALFNPAEQAAVVQGPARTPLAPVTISVNADGTITMQEMA